MTITQLGYLAQWLQVAQSVVAVIGFPILILTLLMIWRQAQDTHYAAMSQAYQNTANGFATVQRYFMENPEYRPYFYDGNSLDAFDPEYVRVSAIAEFFLHVVHNLTIHRRYMQEYPWHVWERSLRDIYNESPILQQFLHDHPDWYTDEVYRILTGRLPTRCTRPSS